MTEHDDVSEGWRKSSASGNGECVEVSVKADRVHVRNTQNRAAAVLTFTVQEWRAFLVGVRLGEFDLPAD